MRPPTLILEGRFWTAAHSQRAAAAIAVDDRGRIAAVESDAARLSAAFPNVPCLRMPDGALGIPAFHDAHNHWGFAAFRHAEPLHGVSSVNAACARLARRSEINQEGWIVGFGWNMNLLPDLSQADLDRISRTRPAAVFDKSTHTVQLNGAGVCAIEVAFNDAVAEGHPGTLEAGRLLESSFLVLGALRLPAAALEQSLIDLEREYLSLGIASVDDLDVLSPQLLETLVALYAAGRMTLPSHAFLDFGRFTSESVPEPAAVGPFAIVGMKSYVDGAFGARSALMREPFVGPGGCGVQLLDRDRFERRRRLAVERGYRHLALHAIGDRAVTEATKFLAPASETNNFDRLRVEHFQLATDDDRRRCADAATAICMQPNFTSDIKDYSDRLGDRVRRLEEYRSALASGALLGFGSDGMPTGPLHGLRCAVEHPIEAQRLSVAEALRAYTIDACRISLTDSLRGSLEVGKEANVAVLSRDILHEDRIDANTTVMATMMRGNIRFVSEQLQTLGPADPRFATWRETT